jgi:SAM-dependent methyltransferase
VTDAGAAEGLDAEGPLPRDPFWLVRGPMGRHVSGVGLDLGPGHQPFPTSYRGVRVLLVDRWMPEQNLALFPELGDAQFPRPHVVCDLARSSLDAFGSSTMDFVIASHVVEHMPNPLGFLDGIHTVLRPGGTLVLVVPDRRKTFDRGRSATEISHVVDDHRRDVRLIEDEHVEQVLENDGIDIWSMSAAERSELASYHRSRSIHVHCWAPWEFNEVLAHAIEHLGHRWELVDATLCGEGGPEGIEFGYVLRRSAVEMSSEIRRERFLRAWSDWRAHRRDVLGFARNAASDDRASSQAAQPPPAPSSSGSSPHDGPPEAPIRTGALQRPRVLERLKPAIKRLRSGRRLIDTPATRGQVR